jgi:hypothetical protein
MALAMIFGYVTVYGISEQGSGDEGAPARIFQCLMAAQVPIIAYFALKWLPKRPKSALLVLALQGVAWITPVLAISWLESL